MRRPDQARKLAHQAMYGTVYVFDYAVPLTLVTIYRMIPDKVRGRMFPDSPSTSKNAVRGLRRRLGWAAVLAAVSDSDVH